TTRSWRLQEIKLDFCRSRRTPRWIAPLLLALAFAFAADVGLSFFRTVKTISTSEKQLSAIEPRSYRAPRAVPAEEVAAARETMQRLSLPWDRLSGALE